MEHDQLCDAPVLLGLLWLCMLLYWAWRRVRLATCHVTPTPATPIQRRSKEPKPFPGLLHKPCCKDYATALLTHFGHWVQPPRRHAPGPVPKARCMPLPALRYAQVVKRYRRRRLARVSHRVVFGTRAAVMQVWAVQGWQINTAFIERVHVTSRPHVAAVGRRVTMLCKHEHGLSQQLALDHVYSNFCLPPASLRLPLPQPEPTNGTGSAKRWRPQTPAMAAGLTDHIWSLRAVLLFRVPPWPQSATR